MKAPNDLPSLVAPGGVCLCPSAERSLERALGCLRSGLTVSAWYWTKKAEAELDAFTDGKGVNDGVVPLSLNITTLKTPVYVEANEDGGGRVEV